MNDFELIVNCSKKPSIQLKWSISKMVIILMGGRGMGIGANIVSQVTAWRIALINYVISWPWLGDQVVKGISHTSEYGPDDLRSNPEVLSSRKKGLTHPGKRHYKNFEILDLWGGVQFQSIDFIFSKFASIESAKVDKNLNYDNYNNFCLPDLRAGKVARNSKRVKYFRKRDGSCR